MEPEISTIFSLYYGLIELYSMCIAAYLKQVTLNRQLATEIFKKIKN